MALDVLDLDDRIIDQDAHHQCQRQQGHGIERKTEERHAQKRRDHRQRQRRGTHQRCTPVAQEGPDHDHREQCAFIEQHHRAVEVLAHRRGVVDRARKTQIGVRGLHLGHHRGHALADVELARTAVSHHFDRDHRFAVEERHRAALGNRVGDDRDIGQPQPATIGQRQLERTQIGGTRHRGDRAHRLFGAAHIAASARRLLLHLLEPARDIDRCDIEGGHALRIELDAHLAGNAAESLDQPDAGHRQQAL